MAELITSLMPYRPLSCIFFSTIFSKSFHDTSHESKLSASTFRTSYGGNLNHRLPSPVAGHIIWNYKSRKRGIFRFRASQKESPYNILGVSSNATVNEIKRAYRKLALKFHPDVNKDKNAEEKFMRIKHAYNTLSSPELRRKYDSERTSGFSYTGSKRSGQVKEEEESFYGLGDVLRDVQIAIGDFFNDLQEDLQNWEASSSRRGKPKSLWEELADIGEELVEFLEQELNISDSEEEDSKPPKEENMVDVYSSIEDNIDEIEATLAKLKKELGL